MNNKLIVNESRFKIQKKYSTLSTANKVFNDFFYNFAKKNYTFVEKKCLCKTDENNIFDDQYVSYLDRFSVELPTVMCKSCGLIRALKYFKDEDVIDFYKNHYRPLLASVAVTFRDNEKFFNKQIKEGEAVINLIEKFFKIEENYKILDLGGGIGGILMNFKKYTKNLYLADYYDSYLDYAKSKGINIIKGGLNEIDFKPDVIILSHVVEHWSDFHIEIENLIKLQKINKTINFIQFPGVDSLKSGRRQGDFLEDIHYPHVYYFSSYVFENIMNRYGFEKIYLDSHIRSIFIYTGQKKPLINHYKTVKQDLIKAEFFRKICVVKSFIRKMIPKKFYK